VNEEFNDQMVDFDAFKDLDVQVLGISVDGEIEPFVHGIITQRNQIIDLLMTVRFTDAR
jgi:alkyl hydroperoxide reductase subunit AhpC